MYLFQAWYAIGVPVSTTNVQLLAWLKCGREEAGAALNVDDCNVIVERAQL